MSKEYTETVEKVMQAFPELEELKEEKLLALGQALAVDVLKDEQEDLQDKISEAEKSIDHLIQECDSDDW